MTQIPWSEEGIAASKLEYLACQFGFFYPAHCAISDCLAGTHILAGNLPRSGQSVMKALLDQAEKKTIRIWAVGSRIELKDILKGAVIPGQATPASTKPGTSTSMKTSSRRKWTFSMRRYSGQGSSADADDRPV